jgi:hypothetical protein
MDAILIPACSSDLAYDTSNLENALKEIVDTRRELTRRLTASKRGLKRAGKRGRGSAQ